MIEFENVIILVKYCFVSTCKSIKVGYSSVWIKRTRNFMHLGGASSIGEKYYQFWGGTASLSSMPLYVSLWKKWSLARLMTRLM